MVATPSAAALPAARRRHSAGGRELARKGKSVLGGRLAGRIRFGDKLGLGKARPVGLGAADLRGLPLRVGRGLVLESLVVAHSRAARPAATAQRAVRQVLILVRAAALAPRALQPTQLTGLTPR